MQADSTVHPVEEVLRFVHDLLPHDDDRRLITLQLALLKEADNQNIDQAKMTNGTSGEMVVANLLGLKWRDEPQIHGWDARDVEGRPCEIKTCRYKRLGGARMNINYTLPRRAKGEQADLYIHRVENHYSLCSGGHYWALWSGVEKGIIKNWHIDGDRLGHFISLKLAQLIERNPTRSTFSINFGGPVCLDCGTVHRIDFIAESLARQTVDWEYLLSSNVESRCRRRVDT